MIRPERKRKAPTPEPEPIPVPPIPYRTPAQAARLFAACRHFDAIANRGAAK